MTRLTERQVKLLQRLVVEEMAFLVTYRITTDQSEAKAIEVEIEKRELKETLDQLIEMEKDTLSNGID
jgi:hypothetical protein